MNILPADVIEFWMGDVIEDVSHLPDGFRRWFQGGASLDHEISDRFGTAVEAALGGGLLEWELEPPSCVALIILLDQFPRNVHRRSPQAFAGDQRALQLSIRLVDANADQSMSYPERVFLLMPFQHSEDIEVQEQGVALFSALESSADEQPDVVRQWLKGTREYAELHRDIIRKFGRFPHRNAVLGRDPSPAEIAWLEEGGQSFGQ